MKTKLNYLFPALALLVGLVQTARPADTSMWVVNKHQNFDQTDSGPAVFQTPGAPYVFEAGAHGSASGLVLGVSVKLPNGTSQSAVTNPPSDGFGFDLTPSFATLAALDAAYPVGQYVLTITNLNDGIKKVTNNLPASVYPSTPHISNFNAAQNINPLADFSLTWDAFTNGTGSDLIQLQVSDASGNTVLSSRTDLGPGTLTGLSNSVIIPAGTLTADQTYSVNLHFYKIINLDTTSYPGANGYTLFWKQTFFNLQTTNPPGVFPIAINGAGSQGSFSAAFSGTNYLAGMQGDGTANYSAISAQMFSTNGSLVGSRILIGRTGGTPSVAFGGTNFVLVWPDDASYPADQIYGQFVSRSGALVGSPFTFGPTSEAQNINGAVALAFDGKNYLVVWDTGISSNAPNGDVHGALFSQTGSLVVPVMAITSGAVAAHVPSVTFGRTNYLVTWNNRRAGGTELYDIYGQFISTNGTRGSAFAISQTPTPRYNPCSAGFDGTNFLVVWNKDLGPGFPSSPVWHFYGRLVSQAGAFPGNELAMVTDANNPVYPFLAFDGANYLMSWHDGLTNSQIAFQFFNPLANAMGPEFNLFAPIGTNAPIFGGVLFDGNRFEITATIGGFNGGNYTGSTGTWGTFVPKSTASPTFARTASQVGTQFSLQLAGTPGINYAIQTSTNLAPGNWTALMTNSPTNGTFSFTDTHATNKSRFYRAVKQ